MSKLKLSLGPKYNALVKRFKKISPLIEKAVSDGLQRGLLDAAGDVSEAIQSGTHGIHTRSGALAKSIHEYMDTTNRFFGFVGVGAAQGVEPYAWLLTDETKTIEPKTGKYLSIPAGANVTNAGVGTNLFASPRDVPGGFFIKGKGKAELLFGDSPGGQFRLLFALVPSVTITGSGVLWDVVKGDRPDIIKSIKIYVSRAIRKLGFG